MTDREKIRAEIQRLKDEGGIGLNEYDMGYENGKGELCNHLLHFLDSLPEKTDSVEGVVSHFAGVNQAAIRYVDPSGIYMTYYAKRGDLQVGDKVKIIITKEG